MRGVVGLPGGADEVESRLRRFRSRRQSRFLVRGDRVWGLLEDKAGDEGAVEEVEGGEEVVGEEGVEG